MRKNPRFTFVPMMTKVNTSHQAWKGETGHITYELIEKHLRSDQSSPPALASPVYYMAGPPAMVAGLRAVLNAAGVDDDDICTEEFAGY